MVNAPHENFDEHATWLLIRQGDKQAFLLLYDHFFHYLLSIGIRISNNPPVAKDACQEFFINLWEKRHSLPDVRNIRGYLYRGYKNQLSKLILQSGYTTNTSFDTEIEFNGLWTISPEADWISREETQKKLAALVNAFKKLPQRQRELLYLRYYAGLSTESIGEKTGLSSRSIYNQVHIALNKLRNTLSNDGNKNLRNYFFLFFC